MLSDLGKLYKRRSTLSSQKCHRINIDENYNLINWFLIVHVIMLFSDNGVNLKCNLLMRAA